MREHKNFWDKNAGRYDRFMRNTQRPFAKRDFAALAFGAALLLVSLFVTIRYGRFYNPFV